MMVGLDFVVLNEEVDAVHHGTLGSSSWNQGVTLVLNFLSLCGLPVLPGAKYYVYMPLGRSCSAFSTILYCSNCIPNEAFVLLCSCLVLEIYLCCGCSIIIYSCMLIIHPQLVKANQEQILCISSGQVMIAANEQQLVTIFFPSTLSIDLASCLARIMLHSLPPTKQNLILSSFIWIPHPLSFCRKGVREFTS